MSNSPLADQSESLRSPFFTKGRTYNGKTYRIDTITLHQVWGHMTYKQLAAYFQTKNLNASSNYGIADDGSIGMFVEECDRSWCSSDRINDYRGVQVEISSDREYPYKMTDKAVEAAIKLCIDVCKRNGITKMYWISDKTTALNKRDQLKDNEGIFTIHEWFSGKPCPGDYLKGKMGWVCDEVNKGLSSEIKVGDKIEMEVFEIKDGFAFGKKKIEELVPQPIPEPTPAPASEINVGSSVTIKSGSVYGGLATSRGKKVPNTYANNTWKGTVSKIAKHMGEDEALIKELNSWIEIKYLRKA